MIRERQKKNNAHTWDTHRLTRTHTLTNSDSQDGLREPYDAYTYTFIQIVVMNEQTTLESPCRCLFFYFLRSMFWFTKTVYEKTFGYIKQTNKRKKRWTLYRDKDQIYANKTNMNFFTNIRQQLRVTSITTTQGIEKKTTTTTDETTRKQFYKLGMNWFWFSQVESMYFYPFH